VNHLLRVWLSGSEEESKVVRMKLEEKIDSFAAGGLEHAVDAITSIWEISTKEGPVPSDTAQCIFSLFFLDFLDECDIRPSLVKSIQEGHLLDRKYWARRSREGAIEPIYFPSTAIETKLSGLGACESPCSGATELLRCTVSQCHLGHKGHLDGNDEDEYIEDSDYENELESTGEPVSQDIEADAEQKLEQKLLPVLSMGSPVA